MSKEESKPEKRTTGPIMANNDIERHEVFICIKGIESISSPFSIGDVEYKSLTAEDATEIVRRLSDKRRESLERYSKDLIDKLESSTIHSDAIMIQSLTNMIVASCVVTCVWSNAVEQALEKIKFANQLLMIVSLHHYKRADYNYIQTPDEYHEPSAPGRLITISLDSWTTQTIGFGTLAKPNLSISDDLIATLSSEEVLKLVSLKSNHKNPYLKNYFLALEWFINGYRSDKNSDKVLSYITALEILFCRSTDTSKSAEVSEGVALLIRNTLEDRVNMREQVAKLYKKRGVLVHNGNWTFSKEDIHELMNITFNVLMVLGFEHNQFRDLKEFSQYVQRLKMA